NNVSSPFPHFGEISPRRRNRLALLPLKAIQLHQTVIHRAEAIGRRLNAAIILPQEEGHVIENVLDRGQLLYIGSEATVHSRQVVDPFLRDREGGENRVLVIIYPPVSVAG